MVWLSTISLADVHRLEQVFAKLTDIGWIVPEWLDNLRVMIEQRDWVIEE